MTTLTDIEGLLFDLDGVLYVGDQPIEGALQSIEWVQRSGIPHRYITNTTTLSTATLSRKLAAMGFAIEAHEIISAPYATVLFLRQQGKPSCYLLLADDAMRDFREFERADSAPDYVVIGDIGDRWSYALLNQVFQMLIQGSQLIALHKGKFWQTAAGLQLDIGAFVAALEYAASTKALIIGKPSGAFFDLALADLGLRADQVAIIGDDIESDVGGGQACGLTGILVKTGKYRREHAASSKIKPDLTLDSVRDLPNCLTAAAGF